MDEELLEVEIGLHGDAALPMEREALENLVGVSWEGKQVRLLSWEQLDRLTLMQERFPSLSIKVHDSTLMKIAIHPQDH